MIRVTSCKLQVASIRITAYLFFFLLAPCALRLAPCLAQDSALELNIDLNAAAIPLPRIFKPNIDLSGRGLHRDPAWPQNVAAVETLDIWGKDIGFKGIYRLQYNLWEISQLEKNKQLQRKLLDNYEGIIRRVSEAGGTLILDFFGTPAGMGRVLDKKSPPVDLKSFKDLVKEQIRYFSCIKKYNIWYEVWSAPDLDDFFIGRKQEYFNLYRQVAEAAKELQAEYKLHIPVGGPSVSLWFGNLEENTVISPEHSLIYDLIRFAYGNHLPLDFISWHAFSSGLMPEKEVTLYKKPVAALIRDWLSYFKFNNTVLIVDEWNYDRGVNWSVDRQERSYVTAAYIPARIKSMYEAGLNNQVYFSLEDFQNNKEGVSRNTGLFWYDPEHSSYKGDAEASYNAMRMLSMLGSEMFSQAALKDDFAGVIATKASDYFAVLIYNYIDPDIAENFLSRNVAKLDSAERRFLVESVKSGKFPELMLPASDINSLRTTSKTKALLKKAKELYALAAAGQEKSRSIKISFKKPQKAYSCQRYTVDSSCGMGCKFTAIQQEDTDNGNSYQLELTLEPYSLQLIVLREKPPEPQEPVVAPVEQQDSAAAEPTKQVAD